MKDLIDNVGKSTTLQNILNHYTAEEERIFTIIYHTGIKMPDEFKYDYMVKTFNQMWYNINNIENVILDRSHISESVFAEMYRGQNTDVLFDQERQSTEDTFLVMLTDSADNLMKREDGLSLAQDIKAKQLELDLFDKSFQKSSLNKLRIDISDNNETQVVEKIIQFIKGSK